MAGAVEQGNKGRFQFLDGAIKTWGGPHKIGFQHISIPRWCDKNQVDYFGPFYRIQISIPRWCDKNL